MTYTNTIYASKLGYGEPVNGDSSSDSVKELQSRLGITVTGVYDIATDTAVRAWQASIGDQPDPEGRSFLGPKQAATMFPVATYTIANDGSPTIASAPDLLAPYARWNPIAGSPGLRAFTGDARKITLHTTETAIKPDWAAQGSGLPHFTFNPVNGMLWQHLPLDIASYTLAGGAHSPNSEAGLNIQIEMIGWASNVPSWSNDEYANLQAVLDWLTDTLDIPRVFPFPFAGAEGYGPDGEVRQSWTVFRDASGIVGHSHAPYNNHWDPGKIDVEKLYPTPPVEPPVEYVTMAEFNETKIKSDLMQQIILDSYADVIRRLTSE